jgi:hypothetical protein
MIPGRFAAAISFVYLRGACTWLGLEPEAPQQWTERIHTRMTASSTEHIPE